MWVTWETPNEVRTALWNWLFNLQALCQLWVAKLRTKLHQKTPAGVSTPVEATPQR